MDTAFSAVLTGAVVGYITIGILPKFLLSPKKRYKLPFLITFAIFFAANFVTVLPKFPLWEAVVRSSIVGLVPIIGALLYVRFLNSKWNSNN